MPLEIEGRLHKVFPTENKSGNFQAREFVVEVESLGNKREQDVLVMDHLDLLSG